MKLPLHKCDKVSEESCTSVSYKGPCLEEINGTDQSSFRQFFLSLSRRQNFLKGGYKGPLGPMGGARLIHTLGDILQNFLKKKKQFGKLTMQCSISGHNMG